MGYIDDSYLQGGTFSDCNTNVAVTTKLFTDLGFILNHEKSVFEPKQVITFLGFALNSVTLTVALTPEKATKLGTKATTVLAKQSPSVREVAELVGLMHASCLGFIASKRSFGESFNCYSQVLEGIHSKTISGLSSEVVLFLP